MNIKSIKSNNSENDQKVIRHSCRSIMTYCKQYCVHIRHIRRTFFRLVNRECKKKI